MQEWKSIFAMFMTHAPPGHTAFSLSPAEHCEVGETTCEGAKFSDFYKESMKRETEEEGALRYAVISEALGAEVSLASCRAPDGSKLKPCTPTLAGMSVDTITAAMGAVAILESGLREDVQVGRGWAKKASEDGGRGRGPGWEVCFAQMHPNEAWRWIETTPELKARAAKGDKAAREEIAASTLGKSREDDVALRACFRAGIKMLAHGKKYCDWEDEHKLKNAKDAIVHITPWDYRMFSLYGTGDSCVSSNNGKTEMRVRLFRKLQVETKKAWLANLNLNTRN